MATDVNSLTEKYGSKSTDMWKTFFDAADESTPSMEVNARSFFLSILEIPFSNSDVTNDGIVINEN